MSQSRYAAYKDSGVAWLGQVPAHWQVKRLKSIFKITKRIANSESYEVLSVTQKGIKIKDVDSNEGQLAESYAHYQLVDIGDFVMNHMDLLSGYVDISKYVGVTSPDYRVFQSTEGTNNHEFLLRALQMCYHEKLFFPFGQGSSQLGRWRLPTDGFMNFVFPLPPLAEQQAIAAFLDRECARIDALVAAQQRMIALLKEKRQALIAHTVTQGLDPAAPRKDSGVAWLGQVPAHWEVKRLKHISYVRARLGWKGLKADEYVDQGYIFLATPNIKGTDIDFTNVNYITQERYDESPEIKLQVGDILLTKDGSTLGTVNVIRHLPKEATVNSSIAVITPSDVLDSIFLFYTIQSSFIASIINQVKDGMGVPHLFQSDINQFPLPLPPLAEQQAIAAFLDRECARIDTLIGKAEQAIALLHERRSALIAAAVTGQIRVANEE